MSYTPPNWNSVNFELESYVVPDGHNVIFEFIEGATVKVYNGTEWKDCPVKLWNGEEWQNIKLHT